MRFARLFLLVATCLITFSVVKSSPVGYSSQSSSGQYVQLDSRQKLISQYSTADEPSVRDHPHSILRRAKIKDLLNALSPGPGVPGRRPTGDRQTQQNQDPEADPGASNLGSESKTPWRECEDQELEEAYAGQDLRYDMDNLENHAFSAQQIQQQITDGTLRRQKFEQDLNEWRNAASKPADTGYKGDIDAFGYTHRTTSSPDGSKRDDLIFNDANGHVLIQSHIDVDKGLVTFRQQSLDRNGEGDKTPAEKLYGSELLMSTWRQATSTEQRRNLQQIKRSGITGQLYSTRNQNGESIGLITPAAIN